MITLIAALISLAPADGSIWDRLAECESGGNWQANTGNGYSGGLQFSPSTWSSMNPPTDYAWAASREQQIDVARRLWEVQGWEAWPGCADKLGLWGTNPNSHTPTGGLPVTR